MKNMKAKLNKKEQKLVDLFNINFLEYQKDLNSFGPDNIITTGSKYKCFGMLYSMLAIDLIDVTLFEEACECLYKC